MAALKSIIVSSVVSMKGIPIARISSSPEFGVIGSVIKLDGGESSDDDGNQLTYSWSFVDPPPIGSKVVHEGFTDLDPDGSVVSFSPDVVGEYTVQLIVSNGTFESEPAVSTVSIRAILVPSGRGLVPDGKFVWGYLRDIWAEVENKEWFETLWSALIQITGASMIELYQSDFNKSIRDIQDKFQRRWLKYEPKLALGDGLSFYLGNHCAGVNGSSAPLDTYVVVLGSTELVIVYGTVLAAVAGEIISVLSSANPVNIGPYTIVGTNAKKTGYLLKTGDGLSSPTADRVAVIGEGVLSFSAQSKTWTLSAPNTAIRVGDFFHIFGPNLGLYRVTAVSGAGAVFTVDRPPAFASDPVGSGFVYRPIRISVSQADMTLSSSFTVPKETGDNDLSQVATGRVVLFGGQAYTLARTGVDTNQRVSLTVASVDQQLVQTGLKDLPWRSPNTLISNSINFEEEGVCSGDVLIWDVNIDGSSLTAEFRTRIVGVDGDRVGFALTTEALTQGVVPSITDDSLEGIAGGLEISGVSRSLDNSLVITGLAEKVYNDILSKKFQRNYWNRVLTSDDDIAAGGLTFKLRPRSIIRNSLIPVDDDLISIPALQEYIVSPDTSVRNGQVILLVRGKEYILPRTPVAVVENSDYVIDGKVMLHGSINFRPGSRDVFSDGSDFQDRGVVPGDVFTIESPTVLAGDYPIQGIVDRHTIRLSKVVPSYFTEWVEAKVKITRKRDGGFIRFAPGVFSANNPAPDRLWAEVSYFDNGPSIESNFGVMVGIKRSDLDNITSNLTYRQAVSGLMYAYTSGPEIDKVRLGAQILLGLPFAEHTGIVRSIEPIYRRDIDGNPSYGRIMVEDTDNEGTTIGTMRAYTFPLDEGSELAGIDTNPSTGSTYAVGDSVNLFSPLSKGVRVVDYLIEALDTGDAIKILQQFHSLKVQVNDNIFGIDEISLVSDFLKKVTPTYVSTFLTSLTENIDAVPVLDKVGTVTRPGEAVVVDDASFGIPTSLMSGVMTIGGARLIRTDIGVCAIRREGRDLVTAFGSAVATSATGGFLNPLANESFSGQLCRVNNWTIASSDYLLIIDGENKGSYSITEVTADGSATVSGSAFSTKVGQHFAIVRKFNPILKEGSATTVTASKVVTLLELGAKIDLVAPGDWFIIADKRYTITRIGPSPILVDPFAIIADSTALGNYEILLDEAVGVGASDFYYIVRPTFLGNPGEKTYAVSGNGSGVMATVEPLLAAQLEPGDELQLVTDDNTRYLVLHAGSSSDVRVTPVFPAGPATVRLCKPNRSTGILGVSPRRFDPDDTVAITWIEDYAGANCTATSAIVPLNVKRSSAPAGAPALLDPRDFFKPGDLLVLSGAGNGSIDIGYGAGVYPVISVSAAGVTVSSALTITESVAWQVKRMRSL